MTDRYRKVARPRFEECEGCRLFYGCNYGKGRTKCLRPWECKQDRSCARACWYVTARDGGFRRDICPLWRQFCARAMTDDRAGWMQAVIAASCAMLAGHMLDTADMLDRTDVKAVIFEELRKRGHYQKQKEEMRL